MHDNDNDDKLDGIELANAMAHYHDDEGAEKPEEYTEEVSCRWLLNKQIILKIRSRGIAIKYTLY